MKESKGRPIGVAIAGCGRIAFLLEQDPLRYKPCTHLGALRYFTKKDRNIRLVAFCDLDLVRAQNAAEYLCVRDTLVTQSFTDLLDTRPDLLIIAASTAAHFELLKAALQARIPRIIIEKPVAFSGTEAKKLRQLSQKSKSVILPNYERRYHPKYIRLRKQLTRENKPIVYRGFFAAGGESLYATKNGDEGVLLHDTTHLLDLVQYLFGPVIRHHVMAEKKRHVLHLEHWGGTTGLIETNLGIGVFHLELEIRLRNRRITVGNGFQTIERIVASRHYRRLKSYSEPKRQSDTKLLVTKNPFVQLYREALYGAPDNGHFYEALDNIEILTAAL